MIAARYGYRFAGVRRVAVSALFGHAATPGSPAPAPAQLLSRQLRGLYGQSAPSRLGWTLEAIRTAHRHPSTALPVHAMPVPASPGETRQGLASSVHLRSEGSCTHPLRHRLQLSGLRGPRRRWRLSCSPALGRALPRAEFGVYQIAMRRRPRAEFEGLPDHVALLAFRRHALPRFGVNPGRERPLRPPRSTRPRFLLHAPVGARAVSIPVAIQSSGGHAAPPAPVSRDARRYRIASCWCCYLPPKPSPTAARAGRSTWTCSPCRSSRRCVTSW
ncbi:hypothetical protein APR09_005770 [Nocardia amikacinitolerans]|nr:hypothetical protein [Nocardia amikacinitolerans]